MAKKDNMVEIINEAFFVVFSSFILFLNQEKQWNNVFTNVYIYGIIANSVAVIIVMIGMFIEMF